MDGGKAESKLLYALSRGDEVSFQREVVNGTDVNARFVHDRTLLHWAAIIGAEWAVKALCTKEADPNAVDDLGRTPLRWAVEDGYQNVVRDLLRYGADPNQKAEDGLSPLEWAEQNRKHELLVIFSQMPRLVVK